ncbi:MAG: ABC transporter permease [Prochlorothrix sp.]|nr:ABC transporter permease [Prochlorothrix sp.]
MLLTALDPRDGLLSLGLGGVALVWCWRQGLQLEQALIVAGGRAILQLCALGLGLTLVLSFQSPWVNVFAIVGVALLWGVKLHQSFDRRLPIWRITGILLRSLALPWIYGILVVVRPVTGFASPEAVILAWAGLGGVVQLGERAGQTLLQVLKRERADLETRLSLGASPHQAIAPHRRQVLGQVIGAQVQTWGQVGLLGLPLFLAGLMLAGTDGVTALGYQVLLLALVLLAGVVAATAIVDALSRSWEL